MRRPPRDARSSQPLSSCSTLPDPPPSLAPVPDQDPSPPEPEPVAAAALPDQLEAAVYEAWLGADPGSREADLGRLLARHPEHADAIRAAVAELARGDELLLPVASTVGALPRIGTFALDGVLGEGGFATVYRAVQSEPVRRIVALKLLHATRSSSRAAQRFEFERDALASLQHPGIARMFEAGAASDGRPWFAMELVDGVPITEFARREELPPAGRIRLFLLVCDAIQHAHQCGVIHRDLKPSNVLVAGTGTAPEPKVIDFGLAKLADELRATELTVEGSLLGTLEYMSPEQAVGEPVDTRTDIWSLGAILFELLTGDLPIPRDTFRRRPIHEVVEMLRCGSPRRASAVLRDSGGPELARALRTELDWVLMRALDPEPSRRYATVADLARDLRNHLRDLPVEARPPSRRYLLRKFVRRHRTVVGSVVAVSVVIGVALAVVSSALLDATRARDEAQRARVRAEASGAAANMAAGFAALELHRPLEVRARLAAVPEHDRHWEWQHLRSRVDGSLRIWHAGPGRAWHDTVLCGEWLVAADLGHLRVHATTDPADVELASRSDTGIYPKLAASPDGTQFLELDKEGRARILSVPDLEVVRELQVASPAGGASPAWSKDGAWIALGDDEDACRVLPTDGGPAWTITGLGADVRPCFDAASRRVACVGNRGTLHVVELATRRVVLQTELVAADRHVFARVLEFAPDGRSLTCAFTDGRVVCVDAATGDVLWIVGLGGGRLSDLEFVAGGARLLVAGGFELATLVLLDPADGRIVHRFAGHTSGVEGIAGARDGRFYTVSRDGTARAWDVDPRPRPLVVPIGRGVGHLAFAGAGRLVTVSHYGTLRNWDLATGRLLAEAAQHYPVARVAYDPSRDEVLVAARLHLTRLAARSLEVIGERESPIDRPFEIVHVPSLDGFLVGGLSAFALVSGATLDVVWIRAMEGGPVSVAAAPDGRRLLAASRDRPLWQLLDGSGAILRTLDAAPATAVAFAPDGVLAAVTGGGGRTSVWDVVAGRALHEIPTPAGIGASWTPDGARFAVGCGDGLVRICDPRFGQVIVGLTSAPECRLALFSADGRHLASLAGPLHGPAEAFVWSTP
ncbi:MAG: protein kinase [Planctomycetes bacterium]|nr:protein kinase [Planctomycetota bacterium]